MLRFYGTKHGLIVEHTRDDEGESAIMGAIGFKDETGWYKAYLVTDDGKLKYFARYKESRYALDGIICQYLDKEKLDLMETESSDSPAVAAFLRNIESASKPADQTPAEKPKKKSSAKKAGTKKSASGTKKRTARKTPSGDTAIVKEEGNHTTINFVADADDLETTLAENHIADLADAKAAAHLHQ